SLSEAKGPRASHRPSHIQPCKPLRLIAVQALSLIVREASQAERRRFESGHPLSSSVPGFVAPQAIISLER
ncbi:MAG: hypothetical protein ACK46L_02410, partial [Synechococcaceae cyanobacterium]